MALFQSRPTASNGWAGPLLIIVYLGLLPCFLAQLRWARRTSGRTSPWPWRSSCPRLRHRRLLHGPAAGPASDDARAQPEEDLGRSRRRADPGGAGHDRHRSSGPGSFAAATCSSRSPSASASAAPACWATWPSRCSNAIAGSKDASQVVPGFGGVLDVVDSVIFSVPLSYFWLVIVRNWLVIVPKLSYTRDAHDNRYLTDADARRPR